MIIFWYGQSFFGIEIKPKDIFQKEKIVLSIDPFEKEIGLKPPKINSQILLITHFHYDHNNRQIIKGNPFIIDQPGEYELKGIFIKGILSFHDNFQGKKRGENIIYKIEGEKLKLCHLGDLGQKELTEEQLEEIGEVDILMIPIGGEYTLNSREASTIISQIEPKIVIPMHYQIPKLKINLEPLENFLKVMGIEEVKKEKKLKINLKNLPDKETKIVVLEKN